MPSTPPAPLVHRALFVFALTLIVGCATLPDVFTTATFGLQSDTLDTPSGPISVLRIGDFPAHLHFAADTLNGKLASALDATNRSVYSPTSHQKVLRDWGGEPAARSLPFGYSPTMIWILSPFTLLPTTWAYVAWTALGIIAVAWMTSRVDQLTLLAAALVFFSPVAVKAFRLGQTSVLSTAAFVFLATQPRGARRGLLYSTLVLWALTAKPPLALTAGAALLATRQWRPVVAALALTAATTLSLSPVLGPGWVADYTRLVVNYDSDQADPAFAWILSPTYMANLRVVFYGWLATPDWFASRVASVCWLAALAAVFLAGMCDRLSAAGVWILAVLALLTLGPHVNATEDLHLFVVSRLALAAPGGTLLALLVAATLWLTPTLPPPHAYRWGAVSFLSKGFLTAIFLVSRQSRAPGNSPPRS